MRISPISAFEPISTVTKVEKTDLPANSGASFKDSMKDAIGKVSDLQNKADDLAVKLASGDLEDVHQAMLAMNKAKLAFDFTLTVRNKVLEAYQEVMRMQV
jgi:flagellar hook-basal body complex protein FliE